MPETRLVEKLAADAGVAALVADRIRAVILAEGDQLPAVVYDLADDEPVNASSGETGTGAVLVDVACIGRTYAEARAVRLAVRAALKGWRDLTGDPAINMCHLNKTRSAHGDIDDGRNTLVFFQFVHEFRVEYTTA